MGGLRTGDKSDGDGAGSSDGDGDGAGSGDGGGVCEIASEKWKMFFEADFFFFKITSFISDHETPTTPVDIKVLPVFF